MSTTSIVIAGYSRNRRSQRSETDEPGVIPVDTKPKIYNPFLSKQTDVEENRDNVLVATQDINSNNIFVLVEACSEAVDHMKSPHRRIGGMSPVNHESYDHLTRTEPTDEHPRGTCSAVCDVLETCLGSLSKKIKNSKYFLAILIILLPMPLSACYMGMKYITECPVRPILPFLVLAIGIMGFLVLVSRIIVISKRQIFPNLRRIELLAISTKDTFIVTFLFLLIEIGGFYPISPNFHQGSSAYCAKEFYSYTYNMNFAALAVSILAMLLHISARRAEINSASAYQSI
ncbi:hypothetical protein NPIL_39911 [Nephila pilipes]|uniref:Uncharacterized protein n=1 Tax=Nephila pilipes TaxID=299642 RepID=A0A8X6U8A8_NEPPI|nr:hypothetical protein NPIL_39911 [Nephila pilipes]